MENLHTNTTYKWGKKRLCKVNKKILKKSVEPQSLPITYQKLLRINVSSFEGCGAPKSCCFLPEWEFSNWLPYKCCQVSPPPSYKLQLFCLSV